MHQENREIFLAKAQKRMADLEKKRKIIILHLVSLIVCKTFASYKLHEYYGNMPALVYKY